MKVLSVGEFDPCHVLAGHRAAMRARGHDYRTAVHLVYRYADYGGLGTPDYWAADPELDREGLLAFAREADVLQFHPGIGQPWSHMDTTPHVFDADEVPFAGIGWQSFRDKARIAYFHGSRNAWANRGCYAEHYRSRGLRLWASTLDYVAEMPATYAPPVSRTLGDPVALRRDEDPLIVAQTPTDPENCHTNVIEEICGRLGLPFLLTTDRTHSEAVATKRMANAGFDHLRGSFSVNTLENCALGLAPLVGLRPEYRRMLQVWSGMACPLPIVEDAGDLESSLRTWDLYPAAQRAAQTRCRFWAAQVFSREHVGYKLELAYKDLL